MAGIPLVAGFVSKWFLLLGSVQAGQSIFAVILLISGVLNIAYFWPIVYGAFFESHDSADAKPLISGPFGGRASEEAVATDGGSHAEGSEAHGDETEAHDDHDHHGGPGPGGWERVGWTGQEGSWLMLGPILVIAAGALVLGIVPYETGFLELIEVVAEEVMG
jgi:NADH:ubiquinone oxidoreductase subunit 5 (subunit L)/multisubunit Na+/H+ antiporter MnhA subunit